jgi:hypothetical protein
MTMWPCRHMCFWNWNSACSQRQQNFLHIFMFSISVILLPWNLQNLVLTYVGLAPYLCGWKIGFHKKCAQFGAICLSARSRVIVLESNVMYKSVIRIIRNKRSFEHTSHVLLQNGKNTYMCSSTWVLLNCLWLPQAWKLLSPATQSEALNNA